MSDRLFKKTELIANIAIIVVAILLSGVLVKRYIFSGNEAASAPAVDRRIPAGTKAALPGVDWAKNGETLVLVLSRDCRYCTQSAPFYQRLTRAAAGRPDLHLLAVLPQEVEVGKSYLNELGVSVNDVRQASPSTTGAAVTPTLILVDDKGIVKNSWIGQLATPEENEVLSQLSLERASNDLLN
ncbi:MAG TPA: hypothetical protein VGB76_01970 [Pyrinomonadaceae bacterium]|jgi:hypothetical protein